VILVTAVAEVDGKLSGSKKAESEMKGLRSYAKERNQNAFQNLFILGQQKSASS
jgi:hypothetical protein